MTYIWQKVNIKRKTDVGKNLQINLCNLLFFVMFTLVIILFGPLRNDQLCPVHPLNQNINLLHQVWQIVVEPKTFSKKAKLNVSLYSSNLNSLNINLYDLIFRPKKKKTFAKEIYSYIFINQCFFSPLNAPKINDLYMTKSQY